MINSVRNTVLSIMSKDNRGYLTPEEFNLFAKQAQMEIFEEYMYDYNNAVVKQNARLINSGYANVIKKLEETIDIFRMESVPLVYSNPYFLLPNDIFLIDTVIYNNSVEVEKNNKGTYNLLSSNMIAPSVFYPIYTQNSSNIRVYPGLIVSGITMDYVRTPVDPKWTWVNITDGEPLFNQGASDYQDFELPLFDEPKLVIKILQYAGISIGELDVARIAKAEEIQDKQEKN
jgi:hypothetical protein